ncbi:sigma-70 family RNA polymerase sigma factor [uncultured Algimonas sp.]|uniref:RNA polymerase sigma factor n=1 Tax=uncultured Algimonas sp. TaxID=1547920 RepID=UPI002603D870|nr:sigma-70 family RNA polymerase sigma factor [uncultured Algimonas sp.]
MPVSNRGTGLRSNATPSILNGDAKATAVATAEIEAERAPAPPKRAAPQSEKALSASKRDAIWLQAIAQNRDAKALTDLFDVYTPKLKGWLMARGAGGATAEDVVQDVMLKVWTGAKMFDPAKASFATWVYRMTRNRWIDHQRKHGRMDVRDPDAMKVIADDEVPSAEQGYVDQQDSHWLNAEIDRLTPSQQVAIRMAYMQFKTHKEISRETGLPLGTVKTRIRSAMQALKANMGEREPG